MFKNTYNYRNKIILLSAIQVLLLLAVLVWSVITGQYPLTLKGLLSGDTMSIMVFKRLRLPRALMGVIGGFGLSISGYIYQLIFKNPLASPDIVGVSSGARDSLAIPFLTTLTGFIVIALLYRQVLILSTSEEEAVSLGVNVAILRFIILMLATLIVSSIICVTGLISFIGLIAPHIARLLTKRNDIFTYITSGFTGAILLTLADILARSVSSSELPVSIFTSLLGAPLLIILLIRANKKEAL